MLDLLISVLPTLPMILPMGVDITPNDDVLPGISQLHTIVGAVMARTHCVKTTTSTRHGHIEYAEFRRLPLPAIRCRARTWAQNTPGFQRELPPVSWTSKLKSREWEAFHVCGSAVEA